jgi:hypothetical protein
VINAHQWPNDSRAVNLWTGIKTAESGRTLQTMVSLTADMALRKPDLLLCRPAYRGWLKGFSRLQIHGF